MTRCDECNNYVYDDESGSYYCEAELDEDDMFKFLSRSFDDCPYFDSNDDYKIVRKQN